MWAILIGIGAIFVALIFTVQISRDNKPVEELKKAKAKLRPLTNDVDKFKLDDFGEDLPDYDSEDEKKPIPKLRVKVSSYRQRREYFVESRSLSHIDHSNPSDFSIISSRSTPTVGLPNTIGDFLSPSSTSTKLLDYDALKKYEQWKKDGRFDNVKSPLDEFTAPHTIITEYLVECEECVESSEAGHSSQSSSIEESNGLNLSDFPEWWWNPSVSPSSQELPSSKQSSPMKEKSGKWTLWKRFSDFYTLNEQISSQFVNGEANPVFPSRKPFLTDKSEPWFLESRRKLLETYLNQLLTKENLRKSRYLQSFLNLRGRSEPEQNEYVKKSKTFEGFKRIINDKKRFDA